MQFYCSKAKIDATSVFAMKFVKDTTINFSMIGSLEPKLWTFLVWSPQIFGVGNFQQNLKNYFQLYESCSWHNIGTWGRSRKWYHEIKDICRFRKIIIPHGTFCVYLFLSVFLEVLAGSIGSAMKFYIDP